MTSTRSWRGLVFIATSLDGYIARADGDITWLTDAPANDAHAPAVPGDPPPDYREIMATVDHLVMGRGTYETALTFDGWPFAYHQVIVMSTRLEVGADDRITVARDLDETVDLLEARGARHVYVDGGVVIRDFLRHDLIDEMTLTRVPVLLGGGLPLFGELDRDMHLRHTGTSTTASGMVGSHYVVERDLASASVSPR